MATAHQRAGLAAANHTNLDFAENEYADLDDQNYYVNQNVKKNRKSSSTNDRHLKKEATENSSYFSTNISEDILVDTIQQSGEETIEEMKILEKTPTGTHYTIDTVLYQIENRISSNPSFPFLFLAFVFVLVINLFGYLWYLASNKVNAEGDALNDPVYGSVNLGDAWFLSIQLLTSAGFDDTIPNHGILRPLYFLQIFVGLVIFAILVGFVTDTIQGFMKSLSEGKTRVMEKRHTLILGWNDTTLLVLIQLARLREQYQLFTRARINRFLPLKFIRDRSSTTVSSRDIVLLNNQLEKDDMHSEIEEMLRHNHFHWHTKLGQNIICRVGDPTKIPDLLRVGAHRASSIITMLTERDKKERVESGGESVNGSTLRTVLCLRRILFSVDASGNTSNTMKALSNETRIVMQLEQPSRLMDTVTFRNQDAATVVYPLDLSMFLNSLMFNCVSQPRLAEVLSNILSFEGNSMHARRVGEVCRKALSKDGQGRSTKDNVREKSTKTHLKFGDLGDMCDDAVFIGCLKAPAMEDYWNHHHNIRWTQQNCRDKVFRYANTDHENLNEDKFRSRTSTLDNPTSNHGQSTFTSKKVQARDTVLTSSMAGSPSGNSLTKKFNYSTKINDHNDTRDATSVTASINDNANVHKVHPDPGVTINKAPQDSQEASNIDSDMEHDIEDQLHFFETHQSSRLETQDLGNINDEFDEFQQEPRLCCRHGLSLHESDILLFIGKNAFPHVQAQIDTETRAKNVRIYEKLKLWQNATNTFHKKNNTLYAQIPSKGTAYRKNEKHVLINGWRNIWSKDADRFMNRVMDIADDRLDKSTITFTNEMSNEQFENLVKKVGWIRITIPKEISDTDVDNPAEKANRKLWETMNEIFIETSLFKFKSSKKVSKPNHGDDEKDDDDEKGTINEIDPTFIHEEATPGHYYSESLRSCVPMFDEANTYYYVLPKKYPPESRKNMSSKKLDGNIFVRHVSSYAHADSTSTNIQRVLLSPLGITTVIILAEEYEKFDLSSEMKDSRVLDNILLIRKLKKLREKLIDELQGGELREFYPFSFEMFHPIEYIHIIAENQDNDICHIALPPTTTPAKISDIIRLTNGHDKDGNNDLNNDLNNAQSMVSGLTTDTDINYQNSNSLLNEKVIRNKKIDFINTEGIYARALSMITAYPLIYKGIQDLFDDEERSAAVEIVNPTEFIPPTELLPLHELKILYNELFNPIHESIKHRLEDMGCTNPKDIQKAVEKSSKMHKTRSIPFHEVRRYCKEVDKWNENTFREHYKNGNVGREHYEDGDANLERCITTTIPLGYLDSEGVVHLLPDNFEFSTVKPTELIILRRRHVYKIKADLDKSSDEAADGTGRKND